MTAWLSALQQQALRAPTTCTPLLQEALAGSLTLPAEHATILLDGLADLASKAGKLLASHCTTRVIPPSCSSLKYIWLLFPRKHSTYVQTHMYMYKQCAFLRLTSTTVMCAIEHTII